MGGVKGRLTVASEGKENGRGRKGSSDRWERGDWNGRGWGEGRKDECRID